jgi:hypothetical protein
MVPLSYPPEWDTILQQRRSVEQRFIDDKFYKDLDKKEKEEDKRNRRIYGDTLKAQIEMKNRMNLGTMTYVEKKFNRPDLKEYKQGK